MISYSISEMSFNFTSVGDSLPMESDGPMGAYSKREQNGIDGEYLPLAIDLRHYSFPFSLAFT